MFPTGNDRRANGWKVLSGTISWSASFYPQPWMNWKRRSTSGLAIDFPTLNVLGFFCYTISTCSFSYSPTIRAQYTARHPASPEPTVRFNDVAFGVHALVMVLLTYSQFFQWPWYLHVSSNQRASGPVLVIVWGSIVAIVALIILVMSYSGWQRQDPQDWAWIDVVYALEYVKLICTLVKYIPQAWVNYKRKSTQGWSILQILFDITGGVLSLLQLVIDASLQDDWSGITGNPLKLGLSNISIAFDLLFIVQHYLLYPGLVDPSVRTEGSPQQPLLTSDGDDSP
ncbi:Cystinosin-like protein [Exophiala dermatitidis]